MQHGAEASPSIILASWPLLVKMLITLEPRGIITSSFVYLCTLTLSSHCHAKRWWGFTEHHFGQPSSFSGNAHNSWTPWYICFKFFILMYFNIFQPLPCKTVTRLCWASFGRSSSFSENAHNSWTPWYIHFKFSILSTLLILSDNCHAKRWRSFAEVHFGRSNWLLYLNYGLCILLSIDLNRNGNGQMKISFNPGVLWYNIKRNKYFQNTCSVTSFKISVFLLGLRCHFV